MITDSETSLDSAANIKPAQKDFAMTDTKTQTTISHAQFAEFASRIASYAASWGSDCLTFKDRLDQPMTEESLERFTKKMQEMLGYINEKY